MRNVVALLLLSVSMSSALTLIPTADYQNFTGIPATSNFTHLSLPWSRLIGDFTAEDCAAVQNVPLVFADAADVPGCEPITHKRYQGQVVAMYNMLGAFGCPIEEKYNNILEAGAAGLISIDRNLPGSNLNVHTEGWPINKGDMPFLSVGFDFFRHWKLLEAASAADVVLFTVNLDCGEVNSFVFWANTVRVGLVSFVGFLACVHAMYGLYRAYGIFQIQKQGQTNAGYTMRFQMIVTESIFLFLAGLAYGFGAVRPTAHSIAGDEYIGYMTKSYLTTTFSGPSFFNTVLVAIFWREVKHACSNMSPLTNVFSQRRYLVLFACLISVVPEQVFNIFPAFLFKPINSILATSYYLVLNVSVSVYFAIGACGFRQQLRSNVEYVQSEKSNVSLTVLATHLTRWLLVYAFFVFLQILALPIAIFASADSVAVSLLAFLLTAARCGMSSAKIQGLLPPSQSSNTSSKRSGKSAPEQEDRYNLDSNSPVGTSQLMPSVGSDV